MNLNFLQASEKDGLLVRALREGGSPLAFAALFSLVSNLLYLAMPLYTFQVYGRVLSSQSQASLVVLTVGCLFIFALSGVIDDFRGRVLISLSGVFDQRVSGHVFSALFEAVVRRDASVRAQALRDLDTFRQTIAGPAAAALFDLPWIPVFCGILLVIDPVVGWATIGGGVVLGGLAYWQDRATRKPLHEANEAALKSYSFTDAALRNGDVVRAMGMLPSLGREWAQHRRVMMERTNAASDRASALSNTIKTARLWIQILIIGLSALLVIQHEIHPGMMFANMILSSRALAPIERIVGSWTSLFNAYEAFGRLNRLLSGYEPATAAMELPKPEGRVTVERVNYVPPGGQKLVLQNLNFEIPAGETVGIVGPSGAGKSTLAKMLVGVWRPAPGGSVRLDGADVYTWEREAFGRFVGYLPQDTELFAGTIRDNIARFRKDANDADVIEAAKMADIHELILRLPNGYDTELKEGALGLSAGQRQRVGLARALFGDPSLIVLDEPNASLDAEGETALMTALERLRERKVTIVIVAHRASALRTADKLLVLKEGRMEAYGPREQIIARLNQTQVAPVRAAETSR